MFLEVAGTIAGTSESVFDLESDNGDQKRVLDCRFTEANLLKNGLLTAL